VIRVPADTVTVPTAAVATAIPPIIMPLELDVVIVSVAGVTAKESKSLLS
jgi:hypothetical protein